VVLAAPLIMLSLLAIPAVVTLPRSVNQQRSREVAQQSGTPVVVTALRSDYGPVLATASGAALYTFSGDEDDFRLPTACTAENKSTSGTPCTTIWPPLLATGPLQGERGVRKDLLGSVERPGGQAQVTYRGHPLYLFAPDEARGATAGENVASFLGIWHLVTTAGVPDAGVASIGTEISFAGVVLSTSTASGTRTLYRLTADPPRATSCRSATGCTSIWPPLLTSGSPRLVGTGPERRLVGVLRRPDGGLQVTYAGHPLYLFAFDLATGAAPRLTEGEDLIDDLAHGVWYTVLPSGRPDPGEANLTTETSASDGTILATASGFNAGTFTVYDFSRDSATRSACVGSCARAWPPLLTSEPLIVSKDAEASKIGAIERSDGTFQVTYAGHPLYLFSQGMPGKTEGEDIRAFGGIFSVVSAARTSSPPPSTGYARRGK